MNFITRWCFRRVLNCLSDYFTKYVSHEVTDETKAVAVFEAYKHLCNAKEIIEKELN